MLAVARTQQLTNSWEEITWNINNEINGQQTIENLYNMNKTRIASHQQLYNSR